MVVGKKYLTLVDSGVDESVGADEEPFAVFWKRL